MVSAGDTAVSFLPGEGSILDQLFIFRRVLAILHQLKPELPTSLTIFISMEWGWGGGGGRQHSGKGPCLGVQGKPGFFSTNFIPLKI